MSLFQRAVPAADAVMVKAAEDFKRAKIEVDRLQREFNDYRAKPPALKDAMAILERHAATRKAEFNVMLDARLANLLDPDLDPDNIANPEQLDLARLVGPGPLGSTMFHLAGWGLIGDRLLEQAEVRLKALGCGTSPTLKQKAKRLAELSAELNRVTAERDEALLLWRRLSGQPAGYPA